MSLRRPHNAAVSKKYSLQKVLSVSASSTNDASIPTTIDVNGVFVSTFPTQWTHMTQDEHTKLSLTAQDPLRFPSTYELNPCYAVVFISPSSTYRFFAEKDSPTNSTNSWYILARPPTDMKLYARGEPGWECDRSHGSS